MSYIASFNNIFFYLVTVLVAAVGGSVIALFVAALRGKAPEFHAAFQEQKNIIRAMWLVLLVFTGVADLQGTTTFLFWCVVVGVILGIATAHRKHIGTQQ